MRYIAYADYYKDNIMSLVLAEFDENVLDSEDKETLEEFQDTGLEELEEEILDSVRPSFYYYALDKNDLKRLFVLVNRKDPENETWPVQVNNIYISLDKAKLALKKDLRSSNIEQGMIKGLFN